MSKRLLLIAVWALTVWAAGTAAAEAHPVPGTVDPGFGTGGTAIQPGSSIPPKGFYGPFGEDMAIGDQNEIYVLQSERDCSAGGEVCSRRLFVQRFLPNGTVDTQYGSQGRSAPVTVTVPNGPNTQPFGDPLASIALAPSGEVLVATVDAGRLSLLRLDSSGQLSGGFGQAGRVTTDFGGIVGRPRLAVLASGRFLVAAATRRPDGVNVVVMARFGPEGALDHSFGSGLPEAATPGVLAIPAPAAAAMSLSPGGRIALGGVRCCPDERSSVFFGRRDSDGFPLRPFTAAKPWRNLRKTAPTAVSAVLALPRGRIVLVGSAQAGVFVARLTASGRRDRDFGKKGIVYLRQLQIGASPAIADSAGNVYVAGHRYDGHDGFGPEVGLVARVTSRGRLSRGFGAPPPGYSKLPSMNEPLAMGFQSSGKLVVFGEEQAECIRSCRLPRRTLTRLFTSRRQGP